MYCVLCIGYRCILLWILMAVICQNPHHHHFDIVFETASKIFSLENELECLTIYKMYNSHTYKLATLHIDNSLRCKYNSHM